MAGKRKVANLTALAILSVLTQRPMHPYEMARALRGWGKDRDMKVKWGSLYSVVAAMEKHRLIAAAGTSREGNRPERTVYRITEAGRAEMVDWTRELLAAADDPWRFRAGLSVMAAVGPDDVASLLAQRITDLEQRIADLDDDLARYGEQVPRLLLVEGEHELALARADLEWTRAFLAEITSGTLPDLETWREFHATGEIPEAIADLAERSLDNPEP